MENKKRPTKKKIRVRKSPVSPIVSTSTIDDDEDYYIPVAALDSTWSGISFKEPKKIDIEHAQGITEEETEMRVIDCDFDNGVVTPPLLLLFPDLRKEDSQVQMPIMKGQISTTSLTKMLMGKKPRMSLLKSCKKPIQQKRNLSRVEEDTESDESIEVEPRRKKKIKPLKDPSSSNDTTPTAPGIPIKSEEITLIKDDSKEQVASNSAEIKLAKSTENNLMADVKKSISETAAEILEEELRPTVKNCFSEDADISSDAILNDDYPPNKRKKKRVKKLADSEVSINSLKVELKESKKKASDSSGVDTSTSAEKINKE